MNITFLIGNGFDIGMGLNSRFSDYFPQYVEESEWKETSLKELADNIDKNKEEWSYFERQIGIYTDKFTSENKEKLVAQLDDFGLSFIDYIEKEQETLDYENPAIGNKFINALKTYYKSSNLADGSRKTIEDVYELNKTNSRVYGFISFNYTNVLERCLGCIHQGKIEERKVGGTLCIDRIDGQIIHVHGRININPIMGLNDVTQIKNKLLAEDEYIQKRLIKPVTNKNRRTLNDENATNMIKKSNIICIYGMSLGETDKKWWQLIIDWLQGSNRQLVIFDYDKDFDYSSQFDWLDKEDSIIEKLKSFVQDNKIDVETLRPRIHIAINKNIFAMNLRKINNNETVIEDDEPEKRDAV